MSRSIQAFVERAACTCLRLSLLIAVLCFGAQGAPGKQASSAPKELVIMQWNVENLFDTEDDPDNTGDDSYTSDGWQKWTEYRYRMKIRHLAEIIGKHKPDILCLQEVENRRVLNTLQHVLRAHYSLDFGHIVHRDGQDHRGIDVAIMSTVEPTNPRWITPVEAQRDILTADFELEGGKLSVIANHWKSQWGNKKVADSMRNRQARAARKIVDDIVKDDSDAAILVVGDFNDNYAAPVITDVLLSSTNRRQVMKDSSGRTLYNLHATLAEDEQGTIYYRRGKTWNSFDGISVSRSLLPRNGSSDALAGWTFKEGSYEVVRCSELVDEDGFPKPFRQIRDRKSGKKKYVTGYSDHLPVKVAIEMAP